LTLLSCPASFKSATPEEREKVCNGCGSAKAKFDFVPDTAYGLSITDACDIHDWHYEYGITIEDKEEADREYLNNMCRLINAATGILNKLLKPLRRKRVKKYYLAVKYFGGPSFWAGKPGGP